MPMKPGTHLGGVRTLADLRDRCRINEISGCWHLLDSRRRRITYSPKLSPRIHVHQQGRRIARSAAWELSGRQIHPGKFVFRCLRAWDCCNPDHLQCMAPSEGYALLAAHGLMTSVRKSMKARQLSRTRVGTKLTEELAQWARESTQTQTEAAHGLGVYQTRVSDVRRGKAWASPSGLFSGLVR